MHPAGLGDKVRIVSYSGPLLAESTLSLVSRCLLAFLEGSRAGELMILHFVLGRMIGEGTGLLLWIWPQFTSPSGEPHVPVLRSIQLSDQWFVPSLGRVAVLPCDSSTHPLNNQEQLGKLNHRASLCLITWQGNDHCDVGFVRNIISILQLFSGRALYGEYLLLYL